MRVLKVLRNMAAWAVIPASLSFVIADQILVTKYAGGPWPNGLPRPGPMEALLLWRNWSLALALVTGLLALPKWRSLIGLSLALTYFYLAVRTY